MCKGEFIIPRCLLPKFNNEYSEANKILKIQKIFNKTSKQQINNLLHVLHIILMSIRNMRLKLGNYEETLKKHKQAELKLWL